MNSLTSRLLLAAVAVAGLSATASAQTYVSVNGGASLLDDSSAKDTFTGGSGTGDISYDTGYAITGAIGRSYGQFRVEGEIGYRSNDLDSLTVNTLTLAGVGSFRGTGAASMSGDMNSLSGMINGWYDIDTGTPWMPFIGGGLGVAQLNLQVDRIGTVTSNFDESDTVFAYQFGAGIGYKVSPTMTVTLSYRYMGTSDPEFTVGTEKVESEYQSHNILVGLNYGF